MLFAFGAQHMAVQMIWNAGQLAAQAQRLQQLGRRGRQRQREACYTMPGRLLHDREHLCAARCQGRRDGQQQGAGAGHHDALAGDREAALGQRLHAAGTKDAGQGPAGKRQQAFARAGGQDQLAGNAA